MTRYILARPLAEILVPDTIQDVLMARIDRLEETPKQTLQLASVIGREFTHRLLARLADRQEQLEAYLQALKASEMIYEKTLFPELVYMFKHALTQDVAYNSLLEQRRQELHQLIGHTMEELYADRLAEQYGTLADHFSRGEAWPKALEYFCKAAARSAEAFATHEALALYEQASAVADRLSDRPLQTCLMIHRAQADLYMLVSDFPRARIAWEQVLTLARQLGDRLTEGIALAGMGQASFWGHQFEQALVDARHASEIAQVADSQLVLAGAHLTTGLVYEVTGRLNEAENELAQALRLSRSAGDVTNEATTLVFMAEFKGWEGKFAEAVRLYTEAIGLARAHNVLMPLLEGLFMYGITLTGKGDYDEAHDHIYGGLKAG